MIVPHFKFSISNPNDQNFGFITIGHDKIFRVANIDEFLKALGYTLEVNRAGLLADEFIWAEYLKDGCTKSGMCLQAKVIEYLSKHSTTFIEKHAGQLKRLVGSCSEGRARENADCGDCLLHPKQKTPTVTSVS